MRICIISAYPPRRGGLAEPTYHLVQSLLPKSDVESITVLANKVQGNDGEERGNFSVVRCWQDPLSILGILGKIRKTEVDILHFNVRMLSWGKSRITNFVGCCLPFLCKLFGFKVIVTLHNIGEAVDFDKMKIFKKSMVNLLGLWVSTRLILTADIVSVTLRSYKEILERKYHVRNVRYVPLGTYGTKIRVNELRFGGNTLLFFGALSPYKNVPFLLDCFQEMNERSDLKLIIAGGPHPKFPNYLERLRNEYQNVKNVQFCGYIPEENVEAVFEKATVVVLPYIAAPGTSAVLHQAFNYGKPVIITDLPAFKQTVQDEMASVLFFPRGDKEAFKKAVKRILDQPELQRKMVFQNLLSARRFGFEYVSSQFIQLYKEIQRKG